MTLPAIVTQARDGMHKAVENTRRELSGIRTAKATPQLLDTVRVEAYGTHVPLTQVALVSAPEPRMLTVQPFDKSLTSAIEKAIRDGGLGLNPSSQGSSSASGSNGGTISMTAWRSAADRVTNTSKKMIITSIPSLSFFLEWLCIMM